MEPDWHAASQERLAATEKRLREVELRQRLLIGSWAKAVWEAEAVGLVVADSPNSGAYSSPLRKSQFWLVRQHSPA